MPAKRLVAIVSRSLATALTREVNPGWPALAGNFRRSLAVVRKLFAAASSLLLAWESTAVFHWPIAALLLVLAALQAATGSVFGFAAVLFDGLLDDGLPDVDDAFEDELPLCSTDRLPDGVPDVFGTVRIDVDDVELDDVVVAEDDWPAELPPEQALNATTPHAAAATTLSRRRWVWVVLIPTECPSTQPVTKSRDLAHAVFIEGCASSQASNSSATHSG